MHTLNIRLAKTVFYIFQAGIFVLLLGFAVLMYKIVAVGGIIILSGILLFLWIVFDSVRKSTHREIPFVVKFFIAGHIFLITGILSGLHLAGSKKLDVVPVHMDLMVFGFGGITIFGAMLHLLPRIVWNIVHIKKGREGKKIPNVFNVLKKNEAVISLYVLFVGVFLMTGANFSDLHTVKYLATLVFITGLLLFFRALFYRLYQLYTL